MSAYFNWVTAVKFVTIEAFTNPLEDSRLGDSPRVCVGTVAENVDAENIKIRANFRPFPKAILSPTMSRAIAMTMSDHWQMLHWRLCRINHRLPQRSRRKNFFI